MTNRITLCKIAFFAALNVSTVFSCSNAPQKSSVSRTKSSAMSKQDKNGLKASRLAFAVESKTIRTSNAASLFASRDTLIDTLGRRYNLTEQDQDASAPILNFPAAVNESAIRLWHGESYWAIHSQSDSVFYGILDDSDRVLEDLFSSKVNLLLGAAEISKVLAVRESDLYVCSASEIHKIRFDKQKKSFSANNMSLACGVVFVTKNDQIYILSKDMSDWTLAIYSLIDARTISKHLVNLPEASEDIIAFAVEDDLSKVVLLTKSAVTKYVSTGTDAILP